MLSPSVFYVDQPGYIYTITVYFTHLADFGVPLFFFISGLLLTMRYYDKVSIGEFYRKRIATIIPPFLAFSIVYLIFNWFVLGERSVSQQLGALVLFDATGPFWFVAVILELYLLFPFLLIWYKRTEEKGRPWLMPSVCLVLYVLWYAGLESHIEGMFGTTGTLEQVVHLLAMRSFVPYLLFFVMGIYVWRNRSAMMGLASKLSVWPMVVPALVLAFVLSLLGSGFLWSLVLLPFAIIMSALLYRLSVHLTTHRGVISVVIATIGVYSFGIYLVHMLAISAVVNRLEAFGIGTGDLLFYVVLVPGTVIVSIIVIFLLDRMPYGHHLSGVRGRSRSTDVAPEAPTSEEGATDGHVLNSAELNKKKKRGSGPNRPGC